MYKGIRWSPKEPLDDIPSYATGTVSDSLKDDDGLKIVGYYESIILPGDNTLILTDKFSIAAWVRFAELKSHDIFEKSSSAYTFDFYAASNLELSVYFS